MMARRPGRPRGSTNKPKPSITEIGQQTYQAALETPAQIVGDTPAPASPEPTFDPAKFEGGYETAVGSQEPPVVPGTAPQPEPDVIKKRGRPPGPRGTISVSGMEQLLLGIHGTLAAATRASEFELDQQEARAIAEAYTEAAKHYPALNIDPKHAAIMNLGSTLSIVYGSRIIAYRARKSLERAQRRTNSGAPPVAPQARPAAPQEQPAAVHVETINGIPVPPPMPTAEIRTGEIAGVGNIVFPADHPLVSGRKN